MTKVPKGMEPYFTYRPSRVGICRLDNQDEALICKLCGKVLKPNSAGANSHTGWHVRQVEARKAASC